MKFRLAQLLTAVAAFALVVWAWAFVGGLLLVMSPVLVVLAFGLCARTG